MSRARRLSEIAKANQPVFSSTNGTQWWLADPSPKNDPQPASPSDDPEPQPAAARQAVVALQESKPEDSALQSSAPPPILFPEPELQTPSSLVQQPESQTPSDLFPQPAPKTPSILFPEPELQTPSSLLQQPESQTPSDLFPEPELQTPLDLFPQPELQTPSNGAISAESQPVPRDLASRLSSLKDRFLSLGRKNRGIELE